MKKKTIHKLFFFIKVLSIIGVLLAVFLLWEQLSHSPFQPCRVNSTINCDAIISGPVANTLGIPTPLYGLVGYIVIFFSAVFHKKKLLLVTAVFGLAFCLWIAYKELFELQVICPICILCQLIMLAVCSLAVVLSKKTVL
jgi:uncharacterized membrane protein